MESFKAVDEEQKRIDLLDKKEDKKFDIATADSVIFKGIDEFQEKLDKVNIKQDKKDEYLQKITDKLKPVIAADFYFYGLQNNIKDLIKEFEEDIKGEDNFKKNTSNNKLKEADEFINKLSSKYGKTQTVQQLKTTEYKKAGVSTKDAIPSRRLQDTAEFKMKVNTEREVRRLIDKLNSNKKVMWERAFKDISSKENWNVQNSFRTWEKSLRVTVLTDLVNHIKNIQQKEGFLKIIKLKVNDRISFNKFLKEIENTKDVREHMAWEKIKEVAKDPKKKDILIGAGVDLNTESYSQKSGKVIAELIIGQELGDDVLGDAATVQLFVENTLNKMSAADGIKWTKYLMAMIDDDNHQSSSLKKSYMTVAQTCQSILLQKLTLNRKKLQESGESLRENTLQSIEVAKLFTDRLGSGGFERTVKANLFSPIFSAYSNAKKFMPAKSGDIDSDLTNPDFATETLQNVLEYDKVREKYIAEQLKSPESKLNKDLNEKKEKVRNLLGTTDLLSEKDKKGVKVEFKKLEGRSFKNIQDYTVIYSQLSNFEAVLKGEDFQSEKIKGEIGELLNDTMFDLIDGGPGNGVDVSVFEHYLGKKYSKEQKEAFDLLKDIQGAGLLDWSDKTWGWIKEGSKMAVMIAVGIAIGMATAGMGVVATAAIGGSTMTLSNALLNGTGFDNTKDFIKTYGTEFAVNAVGFGMGKYLSKARQTYLASKGGGTTSLKLFTATGELATDLSIGAGVDVAALSIREDMSFEEAFGVYTSDPAQWALPMVLGGAFGGLEIGKISFKGVKNKILVKKALVNMSKLQGALKSDLKEMGTNWVGFSKVKTLDELNGLIMKLPKDRQLKFRENLKKYTGDLKTIATETGTLKKSMTVAKEKIQTGNSKLSDNNRIIAAEKILGKKLTKAQKIALLKAHSYEQGKNIAKGKALMEAGFSREEAQQLMDVKLAGKGEIVSFNILKKDLVKYKIGQTLWKNGEAYKVISVDSRNNRVYFEKNGGGIMKPVVNTARKNIDYSVNSRFSRNQIAKIDNYLKKFPDGIWENGKRVYSSQQIHKMVGDFLEGNTLDISTITRKGGLRKKVEEIIEAKKVALKYGNKLKGVESVQRSVDVVTIGDLHGNATALEANLLSSGLVDESFNWIGGDKKLIFQGDILADRGTDGHNILILIRELREQAKKAGGEVVVIAGNHEQFALDLLLNNKLRTQQAAGNNEFLNFYDNRLSLSRNENILYNMRRSPKGRAVLEEISSMKLVNRVDDALFFHTPPTPAMIRLIEMYGIDGVNNIFQRGLKNKLLNGQNIVDENFRVLYKEFLNTGNSFSSRGGGANAPISASVDFGSLKKTGINRVVFGHEGKSFAIENQGIQMISVDTGGFKPGTKNVELSLGKISKNNGEFVFGDIQEPIVRQINPNNQALFDKVSNKQAEQFVKENYIKHDWDKSGQTKIQWETEIDNLISNMAKYKNKSFNPREIKILEKSTVLGREVYKVRLPKGENILIYRSSGSNIGTTGKKAGEWFVIPGFANHVNAGPGWFVKLDKSIALTKGKNRYLTEMANYFQKEHSKIVLKKAV